MEKKDIKTVESSNSMERFDPLYNKQRADVASMRAALLACSEDSALTSTALKQIAVLRVYHQVARIIKYLDLMDKIEDKLYQSIEYTLDQADITRSATWIQLLSIQEKLQKAMIESHSLLQPYLTLKTYEIMDLMPQPDTENPADMLISAKSRDTLRTKAQAVLMELKESEEVQDESGI